VLLFATDKWLRTIDQYKHTGAVLLDLAKAFDMVDHTILCSKLKFYGCEGASYDLLHNYLSDRQQRVLFNGTLSDWATVTIGRIHFRSVTLTLMIYLQFLTILS